MTRLFNECVEIINAEILSKDKSDKLTVLFEQLYPMTRWGKIDWEKITNKIEVGYDHNEIAPRLEQLLKKKIHGLSYIAWSRGDIQIVSAEFNNIIDHFDDVVCVGFETFIFDPHEGWIIEILSDGKITVGTLPIHTSTGIS